MSHPLSAPYTEGQKEGEWSYIPSFFKAKKQEQETDKLAVGAVFFDTYPKQDNEQFGSVIASEYLSLVGGSAASFAVTKGYAFGTVMISDKRQRYFHTS